MQDAIDSLQKQIQYAEAHGESNESIQYLKNELSSLTNPPMPSILEVFNSMVIFFTFLGIILGASMGFDQISRERDEGSLKFLAVCPIYRDAIINGKAIGAIATIGSHLPASSFVPALRAKLCTPTLSLEYKSCLTSSEIQLLLCCNPGMSKAPSLRSYFQSSY